MSLEVIGGHRRSLEVIGGHWRSLKGIGGHWRSLEVIDQIDQVDQVDYIDQIDQIRSSMEGSSSQLYVDGWGGMGWDWMDGYHRSQVI